MQNSEECAVLGVYNAEKTSRMDLTDSSPGLDRWKWNRKGLAMLGKLF